MSLGISPCGGIARVMIGATGSNATRRSPLSSRLVVAVCSLGAALAGVMCGGTTGHEGLQGANGTDGALAALDDASPDADLAALDAGAFDVTISYVDRVLPDVVTPADTGAVGYPWPACPPFIPVDPGGQPVPFGAEVDQIPAVYGPDGGGGIL